MVGAYEAGVQRCPLPPLPALLTDSGVSPAAEPQFRLSLGQTAPHRLTDALTSTRLACAAVATWVAPVCPDSTGLVSIG